MRAARRLSAILAFLSAAVLAAAPDTRRPMTPADLFATQDIGEIQISPDGATVVFTVTATDITANRTTTKLMRVAASGGPPALVEGAPEGASSLRLSPDGARIAFFAVRKGKNALWTLELATGVLTRVCDYDRGNSFLSKAGSSLAWSPDGKSLAFAGTLEPAPGPQDPLVVSRIQYKTRTSLTDNRRSHVFVVPAAGGAPRAVASGSFDEHSIDWGGDGSEIVFLSNREKDPDANLNYDIFAVNVASGAIRRITETPGVELDPKISPDGKWIACTATARRLTSIDSVAEDAHVWVVPFAGGAARELNRALDRRSSSPAWTPDSRAVLYTAGDHGKTLVLRVPVEGGASAALVDRRAQAGPIALAKDGTLVFGLSEPAMPREIFRVGLQGGEIRQLTSLNGALVKSWKLTIPETVAFKTFDGKDVEGWLYPALLPAGKTPMLLSIHGGPHGMSGYGFNASAQVEAAHGYAVLALNPRGSSGYGQAFSDGCVGDWGGGDYKDLMAGVDDVLKTHPNLNPERLGVLGGSYGGFMTNWVITQTTRFKAAVASASLSNLVSFYATSLYQDLVHAEFNGFPWDGDNFALLWKWSPLAHVQRAATPTMFIHGEQDNDVHITQAEEMYTALRRRGVDAVLVRYPREGHGLREPRHRLDSMARTLAWMDRHLLAR